MSQFIKEYKLKQITPMLHFQYKQPGATLRASEVKPKLDKFLCECYEKENKTAIPADWCIKDVEDTDKNRGPALNYKMSIFCEEGKWHIIEKDSEAEKDLTNPPMYFGEMENAHLAIFDKKTDQPKQLNPVVNLQIKCMNQELRKFIDEHICEFFILHNFGMRQSKGYGGFLVLDDNQLPNMASIDACIDKYYGEKKRIFYKYKEACIPSISVYTRRNNKNVMESKMKSNVLEAVSHVYALMKAGINMTRGAESSPEYVKGYIMSYNNENAGSDKAFMKKNCGDAGKYFGDIRKRKIEDHEEYEYRRAMLGLHSDYYLQGKKYKVEIKHKAREGEETIERFMSPVLIKLFECSDGNRVYFLPPRSDDYKEILDKEFSFSIGGVSIREKISTPKTFDYDKFFTHVVTEYCEDKKRLSKGVDATDKTKKIGASQLLKGWFENINLEICPIKKEVQA